MGYETAQLQMADVHHHFSLKSANSFGVDAHASMYASPEDLDELVHLLTSFDYNKLPMLVMGEGSNLLFKNDYEGLIVNPRFKGIEVLEENGEAVVVRVGAGENWDSWVQYATEKGWFGLENLSLIPGSVGSAPIQNIGAYGVELKDHFEWLTAWDLENKEEVKLSSEDCEFAYRSSIFKTSAEGRYIITHVCFRLSRLPDLKLNYGNVEAAFIDAGGKTSMDLRNVIITIRNQKLPDPSEVGNGGSFFKNPLVDRTIFKCIRVEHRDIPNFPAEENQVKIPAAWLIEKAGWKGKRIGDVGTWPTQPLVIVNYGSATGEDIVSFSELIRDAVDQEFGVFLEREVNVVD